MNDRRIRTFAVALGFAVAWAGAPPVARAQEDPPPALDLRSALERALVHSPEGAMARAEIEEARANAHAEGASFRPEASATTTPGYASGLPVMVAGQVPAIAGLSLRTTIYDPARRAAVFGAQAEADLRQSGSARADASTARALIAAYERVFADGPLVEAARRRLESQEAILRRTLALKGEGRATELEAGRAELDVARAKQRLLDRTLGMDLDLLELRRLVDWPSPTGVAGARALALMLSEDPLSRVPEPPTSGNLDAARHADPESQALVREAENLSRSAKLLSRSFQPVVVAQAQYLRLAGYNGYDQYFVKFRPNDFSVGLAVSVPLWTGGRTADASAAARARLERVEAAQRARARDLELAVARAEGELTRARAGWAVAKSAQSMAGEALRVAQAIAAEGRGGPSDSELADIALLEAQEETARAAQAYLAARLALLDLRGDLPRAIIGAPSS